jgi:hypothetical protein
MRSGWLVWSNFRCQTAALGAESRTVVFFDVSAESNSMKALPDKACRGVFDLLSTTIPFRESLPSKPVEDR